MALNFPNVGSIFNFYLCYYSNRIEHILMELFWMSEALSTKDLPLLESSVYGLVSGHQLVH